jgi:hypothetical protein
LIPTDETVRARKLRRFRAKWLTGRKGDLSNLKPAVNPSFPSFPLSDSKERLMKGNPAATKHLSISGIGVIVEFR